MKFIHIAVMTCTLCLVACTPTEVIDTLGQFREGDIESVKIITHPFEGAENISRTSVEIGNDGAVFKWAERDTIGIFPDTGYQIAFPMKSGAGSQNAEFNGGGWALNSNSHYTAYYPFQYDNRSKSDILFTYVGQKQEGNGSTAHLGDFDYMATSTETPDGNQVTFDFKHLGVLLQWKLKIPSAANLTTFSMKSNDSIFVKNAKLNLNTSSLLIEASERNTELIMELSGIQVTGNGQEVMVYMMVAPMDLTGKTYRVQVTDDSGACAVAEVEGKNLEAGKAYALSADLTDFTDEAILVSEYRGKVIAMDGGQITLETVSDASHQYAISKEAKNWISLVSRSKDSYTFHVQENNTDSSRRGFVTMRDLVTGQAIEYSVLQGGKNSYALTESNGRMPAGILTSNGMPTSEEHGLHALVDEDLDTYFETTVTSDLYLDWEGPYPIPIQSMESGKVTGDCCIDGITFHASSNGSDWYGFGWSSYGGAPSTNRLDQSGVKCRERFYRLIVISNHGGPTTQVCEYGLTVDSDMDKDITAVNDLLFFSDDLTTHYSTPMGNYFVDKHVTMDSDRQWLSDAVNEPSPDPIYTEYDVNLYPYGSPLPIDANYDSSIAAVLAEMAYLYPNFIKSIIVDHRSKVYTVKMYDPQGMPVNVTVNSTFIGNGPDDILEVRGKDGKANWATVMDKAILKWNKIYQIVPHINDNIGIEYILPMFTGNGTCFKIPAGRLSSKQLSQAVNVALNNGLAVIGVFTKNGLVIDDVKARAYFAHSVMLSSRSGALFAMRNPRGYNENGSEGDDGVLHIMNNETIPPTIELHFFYPGDASNYLRNKVTPYVVPDYL